MVKKRSSLIFGSLLFISALHGAELPTVLTKFVPKPNFFLPVGTVIKATTAGAIFSFNVEAPVIAEVDEPTLCPKNGEIIFPKGTKLIGTAGIVKSDDRVNVTFYLAVYPSPSGFQVPIRGIVLSADGSAGLKGTVKEYKEAKYISSVVSGAMVGVGQVAVNSPGVSPVVGNALGNVMQTGSQDISQTAVKVDVSITVPPFQKSSIILLEEVVLDPDVPVKPAPQRPHTKDEPIKSEFEDIEYNQKKSR